MQHFTAMQYSSRHLFVRCVHGCVQAHVADLFVIYTFLYYGIIVSVSFCIVSFVSPTCHLHISFSLCTVSHCRGLVCLTCWPSARVSEPLSCTSTKVQSPSLPSTAVWRECATVHPLRVCQSAVWMQVSGVQHWVSCCVCAVWCMSPMALSVSNVFHE